MSKHVKLDLAYFKTVRPLYDALSRFHNGEEGTVVVPFGERSEYLASIERDVLVIRPAPKVPEPYRKAAA